MKKPVITLLLACIMFAVASCRENKTEKDAKEMAKEQNEEKFDETSMEDDAKFAVFAAEAGMMEVKLGELAKTNSSSKMVKDFAQMMITDHEKASNELKNWAANKNVTLPATLSQDKQEKYDEMMKKTGMDFDKAYADAMVDDHKKVVEKFEKQADNGKDAELKTWASEKLPTLRHHLEMAEDLKDSVKNMKK